MHLRLKISKCLEYNYCLYKYRLLLKVNKINDKTVLSKIVIIITAIIVVVIKVMLRLLLLLLGWL